MPEALIFDLFGTLVFFDDSRVPFETIGERRVPRTIAGLDELLASLDPAPEPRAFAAELRRISAEVAAEKRAAGIELSSRVRFERTLVALGVDAGAAAAAGAEMARRHMATLAAAVVCPADRLELLAALGRRHRLALLSNFDCGATGQRILAEHGLAPCFETIVLSDEEGLRKPTRELFERTCGRLGVAPGSCLYVGDTLVEDIEGATGAGLGAVWIHPDPQAKSPALAVLPDVRDLGAWLDSRPAGLSARDDASR